VFSIDTLDQAPAYTGAQDASTQVRLYLGYNGLIDCASRVKDDALRRGFGIGRVISLSMARHVLKHPIKYANVKIGLFIVLFLH